VTVASKIKDLTGPGHTDRFGIGGTDLGVTVAAPDGRLVSVFGDTFDNAGVGGPGWRSPVVLFGDPRPPAPASCGLGRPAQVTMRTRCWPTSMARSSTAARSRRSCPPTSSQSAMRCTCTRWCARASAMSTGLSCTARPTTAKPGGTLASRGQAVTTAACSRCSPANTVVMVTCICAPPDSSATRA
jgi:Domain of unknown function (DUF4185)